MKRHFRRLSPPISASEARHALKQCIARTDFWLRGSAVARFEGKLARMAGVAPEQVIATASCTDALAAAGHVLLNDRAHDLQVCPLTYAGTYSWNTQLRTWVNCDEDGWPVAPVDVGVELWGRPWPRSARPPIMDCAHRFRPEEVQVHFAEGAQAVCWSFGPQKELPGVRGGACVFAETSFTITARAFLNNGIGEAGPTGAPGRKGLMANADAVFLGRQMDRFLEWREERQEVLACYERFFPSGAAETLMTLPGHASGHLCVLRFSSVGQRETAATGLSQLAIEHSRHYPVPSDAPQGCQDLSQRILTVPCHPQMRFHDVRRIAMKIIRSL